MKRKGNRTKISHLLDYFIKQLDSGNILNIFKPLSSLPTLYFLIVPYYISYFVFQNTKNFAKEVYVDGGYGTNGSIKVAHFTDTFYEVNGVAVTLQQILKQVKKMEYDYNFITCSDHESILGGKVFKPLEIYDLPEYPELKLAYPPILDIVDYCFNEDFSHIHTATPGTVGLVGLLVAKLLNKPLYSTYHTAFPQYIDAMMDEPFMTDVAWSYMKWYYKQCDKVFARSEVFRQELINRGLDESKVFVMRGGVDLNRFVPGVKDKKDKKRLLYLGRVSIEKNLDILVEAFKMLNRNDVEMYIVGDGPYKEEMENLLSDYDVTFTGYLFGDDVVKQYQQADFFVFPSSTDTMGNVILEAHACGLPTIVTDKGGPQEHVVDKENGFIIHSKNAKMLCDTINIVINNYDLVEMSKKCRESVKHMTFENSFNGWMKEYENK